MAGITGILCQIITGDVDGAGTDGNVYLGIGGREFCLDSAADDFERDSWREYVFGRGPIEPNLPAPQVRVTHPEKNDPRLNLALDSVDILDNPVYLRFEPSGDAPDWNLVQVHALVYRDDGVFVASFSPSPRFRDIWLGDDSGKILYLSDAWWPDPRLDERVKDLGSRFEAIRESIERAGRR